MGKEKRRGAWRSFLAGGITALGLYLAGVFVLAFFLARGLLPESSDFLILSGFGFTAALAGGVTAAKRSLWATMPSAILNTGIFLMILVLIGFTVWPETFWSGQSMICVAAILVGGLLGGVLGAGRKKRKKRGHLRTGIK